MRSWKDGESRRQNHRKETATDLSGLFSDGIVPADMIFQCGNRKEADRRFMAAWRFLFFMLFSS